MASLTIARPDGQAGPSLAARAGMRIWRLVTSVNLAVAQSVGVAVTLRGFGDCTLLIAKRDPGAPIVVARGTATAPSGPAG
ncbi:MAG: hypothetical protein HYX55_05620 [Chloroflexi bacterium]|nr:hypothetical protein [Chloroflexota bacterium]